MRLRLEDDVLCHVLDARPGIDEEGSCGTPSIRTAVIAAVDRGEGPAQRIADQSCRTPRSKGGLGGELSVDGRQLIGLVFGRLGF
jgi:hypothetical protein